MDSTSRSPRARSRKIRGVVVCAAVAAVAAVLGCSRQPPGRYELSGVVTFAGKPVPLGQIMIEPDPAAGNRGPQAVAWIKDGRYRTQSMKGAVAGDVLIHVSGFDGVFGEGDPYGKPLFARQQFRRSLPPRSSTLDIVVP